MSGEIRCIACLLARSLSGSRALSLSLSRSRVHHIARQCLPHVWCLVTMRDVTDERARTCDRAGT